MTLKECYDFLEADYEGVMGRLMAEERVNRFLKKFLDAHMLEEFEQALEAKDYEVAFRSAHNMKGVCANLGISVLGSVSSDVTEELRGGEPQKDISEMVEKLRGEYEKTVNALESVEG